MGAVALILALFLAHPEPSCLRREEVHRIVDAALVDADCSDARSALAACRWALDDAQEARGAAVRIHTTTPAALYGVGLVALGIGVGLGLALAWLGGK